MFLQANPMAQPNYSQLLRNAWYGINSESQSFDADAVAEPSADPTQDLSEFLGEQIAWEHTFAAQEPDLKPVPASLPIELRDALQSQGIVGLYSHQVKCYRAIRAGKDVVLTPPTAAGKTLAAYIPVLSGVMQDGSCSLSLYGLKALASDQTAKLDALLAGIPEATRPRFAKLTGDIGRDQREVLLATEPHLLAMTPDLLHFELKQVRWSEDWQRFLQRLRYVVLDELHTYSGVFGANLHWLLARLKLAVDSCGGNSKRLQFVCLSATVGNPKELASQLIGRPAMAPDGSKQLVWIHRSGAAQAQKRLVVLHPTYNANAEVARITAFLLCQGMRGLTFTEATDTTKRLVGLVQEELRLQGSEGLHHTIASFYGALDDTRRHEIMAQLEAGTVRWIISTKALEVGVDLPQLDVCIIRGFPDNLMRFYQQMGRAGRKQSGLVVFVPIAQSLLDVYFTERAHLLSPPELVHFNPNYPVMVAKHLMCAAAESGFSFKQVRRYFGEEAVAIAQMLHPHLKARRDGILYATGFPHGAVNLRGGTASQLIKLVDGTTGKPLETMSADLAHRQVFPGAIYQLQQGDGRMQAYRSESLEQGTATLVPVESHGLRTQALTQLGATRQTRLVEPKIIPLNSSGTTASAETPYLTLELGFGKLTQQVQGYDVQQRQYVRTCLHRVCVHHKAPLPGTTRCPACGKKTREAEITKTLDTVNFAQPYATAFESPLLNLAFNSAALEVVEAFVQELKQQVQTGDRRQAYQPLWDYPSHWVAVHSVGHLLIKALPLVVLHAQQDLDFLCEAIAPHQTQGLWYDTSDGGNGATEAILRYWDELVPGAIALADACGCEAGCPRCLSSWSCPDQNKGLVKQVGVFVLGAMTTCHLQSAVVAPGVVVPGEAIV